MSSQAVDGGEGRERRIDGREDWIEGEDDWISKDLSCPPDFFDWRVFRRFSSEVLALKPWHLAVHDADLPKCGECIKTAERRLKKLNQLLFHEEWKIFIIRTDINPLIP